MLPRLPPLVLREAQKDFDEMGGGGGGGGGAFAVAGTDDGITWWSVRGRPASDSDSTKATSAVEIDFSPKGGPAAARATFSALTGMLRFADGNGWTRVEPVPVPGGSTVEGS